MRRNMTMLLAVVALAGFALPSVAAAQARRGFWASAGLGAGSATITCDDCESNRETGGVVYLRLGGSVGDKLLVGMDFNLWAKTVEFDTDVDGTVNLYNLSGSLAYYPASQGFFVKGGVGVAIADVDVKLSGTTVTVDIGDGLGFIVGAGYDIPIGPKVSLTPGVNFWYGQLGNTRLGGEPFVGNWKQNIVDFTIGVTFRH